MKEKEGEIQKLVLKYLRAHPLVAWCKVNSTGVFRGIKSSKPISIGLIGESDIIGQLKDGRFLAIEVKAKGRKPSDNQLAFLELVSNNNGVSGWTDSVDGVKAILGANTSAE